MCISEQKANAILGKSSHLVTGHVHCWSCFPFNWKKGSLHNFPTQCAAEVKWRLSLMLNQLIRKTLLSIDLCDLCGLDLLEGRLPKPHSYIWAPAQVLGRPNSIWEMPSFASVFGPLLQTGDRRILSCQGELHPDHTHVRHQGAEAAQKESAINYVSQIAFSGGPTLFRHWMRHRAWLYGYLSYRSMGGVEHTRVVWKHLTLWERRS